MSPYFLTFIAEPNVIMERHEVPYRLSMQ